MRRLLIVPVVAALALVALSTSGGALKYSPLDVELASHVEPLTFTIEHTGMYGCDAGTIAVTSAKVDGTPVTPISVTEDAGNPNKATIVLASTTTPGTLVVLSTCHAGDGDPTAMGEREFAAVAVTKTTSGTVPDDAHFTVLADCGIARTAEVKGVLDQQQFPLTYGATGGTKYLYFDREADCTFTEPENGGATSTTITPDQLQVTDTITYAVAVVNEFPVEVSPSFTG